MHHVQSVGTVSGHTPFPNLSEALRFCPEGLRWTYSLPSELGEHIQCVMTLADQYAFGGVDYVDPEEVMNLPKILHFK